MYVAAGIYNDKFFLVRPSSEKALPYVTSNPTGCLWTSTNHHAHMYRVESDGWLYLEEKSWGAEGQGIDAPKTRKLSLDELTKVKKSFEQCDYK